MDMDDLLSEVSRQVQAVRERAIELIQLGDRATKSFNPEGKDDPARAGNEYILKAFEDHESSVRSLLESIHAKIGEYDDREVLAVSGDTIAKNGSSNLVTPRNGEHNSLETFDADASRTVAIKNVGRDIAHSLQSEVAWRKNAYRNAREVEKYFHRKLAFTFPTLSLEKGRSSSSTVSQTNKEQPASKYRYSVPLAETLSSLPYLRSYELEAAEGCDSPHVSPLRQLRCDWNNGLRSVIHFTPLHSPGDDSNARPERHVRFVDEGTSSTTPNTNLLSSSTKPQWNSNGTRVTWIEVMPHKHTANNVPPALARELTVASQQKHFQLVRESGEARAVHQLLRWMSSELMSLERRPVVADFASPFHLDVNSNPHNVTGSAQ